MANLFPSEERMMVGQYRIANLEIAVASVFPAIHRFCEAYRDRFASSDIAVSTTEGDIATERLKSAQADKRAGLPQRNSSDHYLETLAVYRKIAERLPEFDAMLVHGSCIAVDGKGYLFMSSSGTGKSTHTRLWRELLGSRAIMVNDDKPIIRLIDGKPMIFGTPWDGKHRLSTNIGVPLKGACFLRRGQENAIEPVSPAAAFPQFLKHTYRPEDPSALQKTLELIDVLVDSVPMWQLACTISVTAAQLAYDTMKG
ncbi:MAG: hypothetical protein IJG53_07965 [Eggerthellaceae bacterium]|nr:hypothetical protein [Eggerthellaceae bacterium]